MPLPIAENHDRLTYWLFYAERSVSYAYSKVLRAHCEQRGKHYVITPPQWGALALLLVQDGLTIGSMSQMRGVEPPVVTGIVTRLEQIGVVERQHDREDRRVVKVFLTDEGRDIAHTLRVIVEDFEQSLKQGFAEGEIEQFLAQLQHLIVDAAKISDSSDSIGLLTNSRPTGDICTA